MNFNFLESAIKSELNDYSKRSAIRITAWINECHRLICQKRRWRFLVVRESDEMEFEHADTPINIETDIEVGGVAVPAQNIISIYDVTDGTYHDIKQTTMDQLRGTFRDNYSGEPEYWWYVSDKEIQFYPLLSSARKFIFSFQKKLSTYTTNSTSPLLIPDEYVDVLKELVLYKAYRYKTDDRAGAVMENYNALMGDMIQAEANKTGIVYDSVGGYPERLPRLVDNS